jgi:hypothetical protein
VATGSRAGRLERQALDVPIRGQAVEIDILSENQQLEIARALRGVDGEVLLDHAWQASVSWFRSRSTSLRFLRMPQAALCRQRRKKYCAFSWTNTRLAKRPLRCTTLFLVFTRKYCRRLAAEPTQRANNE